MPDRTGRRISILLTLAIAISAVAVASWALFRSRVETTTLSDFSVPFVFGRFNVPEDNPLTIESVALGRRLFYDPLLSSNNQVSCSTCHMQHLAFTDGRTNSVGVSGMSLDFNSPSLANLMWGPQHFFWNGRVSSLEEQALVPLQHVDEMNRDLDALIDELSGDAIYDEMFDKAYGNINATTIAKALASFQRTLISDNSRYDQYLRGEVKLTNQEEQGRKLFMAHPDTKVSLRGGNCIDCHSQFLTSGFSARYDGFSNNGLDDNQHLRPGLQIATGKGSHRGLFKVPTLRNIALTAPYMHDGRFQTLHQVLDHYNEGIKVSESLSPLILEADNRIKGEIQQPSLHLTGAEKDAIIAFLHTLTDDSFLTNPDISNPFLAGDL
jgi:cytochrome c peroxidase